MRCPTFSELALNIKAPSNTVPDDQEPIFYLGPLERCLLSGKLSQSPRAQLDLCEIVLTKLKLSIKGDLNDYLPYIAQNWGVYLKPLKPISNG